MDFFLDSVKNRSCLYNVCQHDCLWSSPGVTMQEHILGDILIFVNGQGPFKAGSPGNILFNNLKQLETTLEITLAS